jgi:hypothetical protein
LGHATVATTENYYINTKPAMRAAANARKVCLEGSENKGADGEQSKTSEPEKKDDVDKNM